MHSKNADFCTSSVVGTLLPSGDMGEGGAFTMNHADTLRELQQILDETTPGLINGSEYIALRKQSARLCLDIGGRGKELEALHHLTEAHGVGLRQSSMLCKLSHPKNEKEINTDYFWLDGYRVVLDMLKEFPPEWTIIQLTREFDPLDHITPRQGGKRFGLKHFHLTRMPCGLSQKDIPFVMDCSWPDSYGPDPVDVFCEVERKVKTVGSSCAINRNRKEAAELAENYCSDLAQSCFNVWRVCMLGKLVDADLQTEIRTRLNYVFEKCDVAPERLSSRHKYLAYILAEGCTLLSVQEIDLALVELFPDDEALQDDLYKEIVAIQNCTPITASRHPVLLILDDHLDIVPWESAAAWRAHPYSRVPSIHFVHAGLRVHRNRINNGLIEVMENDVCIYILNPDDNLPCEKLQKFLKERCPKWVGIYKQRPTEDNLIEALTKHNIYMYCGHGTGHQYFKTKSISKLDQIQPLQFLFGCNSGALFDHGGNIEMTGDILQYVAAGSGSVLGMLWSVTSTDVDLMTMDLLNCLISGTQIDPRTLKKTESVRETELLRAMKFARETAKVFTNGAALIARGLPTKIVTQKP